MSSFEKALVYHCSPTLCGLKPANLLSLSKDEYPHLPQLAAAYARLLEDKGIRLTILCSCGCRWLLLVYHQSMLAAQLKQPRSSVCWHRQAIRWRHPSHWNSCCGV